MKRMLAGISILAAAVVAVCAQDDDMEMRGPRREDGRSRQKTQERAKEWRGGMVEQNMGGGQRREEMLERMLDNPEMREKLGISEEKAGQIKDQLHEMKTRSIELRAEMEKLGLEQAKAISAKELDRDRVMELVEKLGGVRTEFAKLQVEKMLVIRENMDPAKMEEIRGRIREHVQKRRMENREDEDAGDGRRKGREEKSRRRKMESEDDEADNAGQDILRL